LAIDSGVLENPVSGAFPSVPVAFFSIVIFEFISHFAERIFNVFNKIQATRRRATQSHNRFPLGIIVCHGQNFTVSGKAVSCPLDHLVRCLPGFGI
jgi:hypothetical protein